MQIECEMHDAIVSGGGYNGISHGQKVSFSVSMFLLSLLLRLQKIAMEGNAPQGTLLFGKGEGERMEILCIITLLS